MIYNSPLYSAEDNLEVAIGAIAFRDETIANLRQQIKALRELLEPTAYSLKAIEDKQYAHLKY